MHHVADHYYPTVNHVAEPHQNSGNQKEEGAYDDGPKVKLLPTVKESCIFRRQSFSVANVSFNFAHPLLVRTCPVHRREPVQELKEKEEVEEQAEPRMEQTCHRSAAKERCEPAIKPRRID